jgi:catechol 2,3-dioxygenase-like lactoylglutathione lyase family enzyme
MGELKIEGITHWSIPVNDLTASEAFYGELLGFEPLGRLGNAAMSCFGIGDQRILLCEGDPSVEQAKHGNPRVHHSFTVTPETLTQACKLFAERKVDVIELFYRPTGFFTGRELYFYDPSGNRLELRDPTWAKGMPEPSYDEIVRS